MVEIVTSPPPGQAHLAYLSPVDIEPFSQAAPPVPQGKGVVFHLSLYPFLSLSLSLRFHTDVAIHPLPSQFPRGLGFVANPFLCASNVSACFRRISPPPPSQFHISSMAKMMRRAERPRNTRVLRSIHGGSSVVAPRCRSCCYCCLFTLDTIRWSETFWREHYGGTLPTSRTSHGYFVVV